MDSNFHRGDALHRAGRETMKGTVTRLLDGGGIEIDGQVIVVPQVLLGVFVRVDDQVEVTRVPLKSGRYINIVRVSLDPNTIIGERVRVNGDWASAAEVEAYLVQMLGPEIAARMMDAARENAKLTDEEIKAAVARHVGRGPAPVNPPPRVLT